MFMKTIHATAAVLALASTAAVAAPAFDANIELDTKYSNAGRGASQGGRVEMNVASKTDKGGFVAGRASYMAGKSGTASVDDMWVQIGNAAGDIKLGRFEASDLFPLGKDVIVDDDGIGGYRANQLRGRMGSAAHAALSFNAGSGVSAELGVIASGKNSGVRPTIGFSAGGLNARVGLETGKNEAGAKVEGFGATIGTGFAGGAVNVNFSNGKVGGIKSSSIGLNGVFGAAGIGYIMDKTDGAKENNVYVAYSLPLFQTGATFTPALGYSKASGGSGDGKITAGVRVNYAF
jgi:Porin-like glycoporin RafY